MDTVEDDYLNLSARVTNITMANKEKFDSESITSTTTLTPHSEIKSNTGASVTFEEPSKKEKKPLLIDKKY